MRVEDKRIELYDSDGLKPANRQYMEDMRRYMYDELTAGIPEGQRPSYNVWKREWSYQDKSRDSPKQQNGNDCGVFTLLSIYLLSRGVVLSEASYDQRAIVNPLCTVPDLPDF